MLMTELAKAFGSPPRTLCLCVCVCACGGLQPPKAWGRACRAQHSADQWDWDVHPWAFQPYATLIDGAVLCQDWPRLVCGVHYRASDSSCCGEQCVIHTYTHTPPVSIWIKERYKVFLWFLITLQFGATCVPRVMHKHQLEYAAAQCWFTRSIWAELLKGKLFFIDRNLLASSNRMCECVEVGIHDIPVLFFCFSFFFKLAAQVESGHSSCLDTLSFLAFLCKEVKPEVEFSRCLLQIWEIALHGSSFCCCCSSLSQCFWVWIAVQQ